MKLLSQNDVASWADRAGLQVSSKGLKPDKFLPEYVAFEAPTSALDLLSLCVDILGMSNGKLLKLTVLWIAETGVWNQWQEDIGLSILRKLRGESDKAPSLKDAPFHLFESDEAQLASAILLQCLIFRWDCWVFSDGEPSCVIQTTHDALIWISYSQLETRDAMLMRFADWNPQVRKAY